MDAGREVTGSTLDLLDYLNAAASACSYVLEEREEREEGVRQRYRYGLGSRGGRVALSLRRRGSLIAGRDSTLCDG